MLGFAHSEASQWMRLGLDTACCGIRADGYAIKASMLAITQGCLVSMMAKSLSDTRSFHALYTLRLLDVNEMQSIPNLGATNLRARAAMSTAPVACCAGSTHHGSRSAFNALDSIGAGHQTG